VASVSPQAQRPQPVAAQPAAPSKLRDTAALVAGCASFLGPVCHAWLVMCARRCAAYCATQLRIAYADMEADALGLQLERHRLLLAFCEHENG
jgi:hypothetical protein